METRKSWADLTTAQKISVLTLSTVQLTLLFAALMDIYRRSPDQIRGSKSVWTTLSFINFFGPVAYFTYGIRR